MSACPCAQASGDWSDDEFECTYEAVAASGTFGLRLEYLTCRRCGAEWRLASQPGERYDWERVSG